MISAKDKRTGAHALFRHASVRRHDTVPIVGLAIGLNPDWLDSSFRVCVRGSLPCRLHASEMVVLEGCGRKRVDIYEGTPFIYTPGGNKGFQQGWMVREGGREVRSIVPGGAQTSSIRVPPIIWRVSATNTGAHTGPASGDTHCTHTKRLNRREIRSAQMRDMAVPFTVCGIGIYMAADCAAIPPPPSAIGALISHEIVKSPWE